ncbi:nascent polypeptide-associated complex protein [Candidatus Altiarchaeota archaeon]
MNPKQMKKMMKKMGIKMNDIDAEQVIIKCVDKDIIIDNPQVVVTSVQGQDMFQVSGDIREEGAGEVVLDVTEEDITMVAEQAQVSKEKAREVLAECGGDLAEAIMKLKA